MLNINQFIKASKLAIALFFLTSNAVSCQEIKSNKNDYVVIKRESNEVYTDIKKIKSKTEKEDLRFSKELASSISKDLFNKIDKIIITKEIATFQKKDTINYFVYDFILKKNINVDQLKSNLNFGVKHVNIYEMPISCNTFLNDDKITCTCKGTLDPEYLKKDNFISTIKANTEFRVKQ